MRRESTGSEGATSDGGAASACNATHDGTPGAGDAGDAADGGAAADTTAGGDGVTVDEVTVDEVTIDEVTVDEVTTDAMTPDESAEGSSTSSAGDAGTALSVARAPARLRDAWLFDVVRFAGRTAKRRRNSSVSNRSSAREMTCARSPSGCA